MHDVEMLCLAIDAGDDLALKALADALEEAGDRAAVGLRSVLAAGKHPLDFLGNWWWCLYLYGEQYPSHLAEEIFYHLEDGQSPYKSTIRCYSSRSSAFLALARALTSR